MLVKAGGAQALPKSGKWIIFKMKEDSPSLGRELYMTFQTHASRYLLWNDVDWGKNVLIKTTTWYRSHIYRRVLADNKVSVLKEETSSISEEALRKEGMKKIQCLCLPCAYVSSAFVSYFNIKGCNRNPENLWSLQRDDEVLLKEDGWHDIKEWCKSAGSWTSVVKEIHPHCCLCT